MIAFYSVVTARGMAQWHNTQSVGLAINRSGVQILPGAKAA